MEPSILTSPVDPLLPSFALTFPAVFSAVEQIDPHFKKFLFHESIKPIFYDHILAQPFIEEVD